MFAVFKPGMARLFVDIQLVVLIVYQEAASSLVHSEMGVVPLRQQIDIITLGQLRLDLNSRLAVHVWPSNGVNVAPMIVLATFTQTCLYFWS